MQEKQPVRDIEELTILGRALSLDERLPLPTSLSALKMSPQQEERGRRRLKAWSEAFEHDDALYQDWLKSIHLSEQELLYLLAETPDAVYYRLPSRPGWFRTFSTAFMQETHQHYPFVESLLSNSSFILGEEKADVRLLLSVVEPLLRVAYKRLLDGIQTLKQGAPAPTFNVEGVMSSLSSSLLSQLQRLLERTLILEFRVAQQQGILAQSKTLPDALRVYAQHLRHQDVALTFFSEYPVLARQVTLCIEQWCENNLEMLTRLSQDWSALRKISSPDTDPGALQKVQSQAGDTHRGGHSVQILHFATGPCVLYKPRSLAIDEHFQELLLWLNAYGQEPALRPLWVLNREDYGWTEWIEALSCTSEEEIERFYLRQGANLALLYALGATDFHYENIIAAGEYPMLVDLEALLHVYTEPPSSLLSPAERLAYESVASSVTRTLLLPSTLRVEGSNEWVEISGLGAVPGQLLPGRALQLKGLDTGELHFVREQAILEGGKNRPSLNGADVDIRVYLPQIITGFSSLYHLLLSHRADLLAEHGMLARFASDTTRVVLRSTMHYGMVLHVSRHPYLLHDELDQERVLKQLWCAVKDRPHLRAIVDSEQEDLQRGDIPFFTTQANSRNLWTSSGKCIANFFEHSSFELLQLHWQKLSEPDLERQLWFIRASFTTLMAGEEPLPQNQAVFLSARSEAQTLPSGVAREELVAAACSVGNRICQLATREEKGATWLGLAQQEEGQWRLAIADLNLYTGLTGIVLALAYLGKLTAITEYTSLARAGYATIQEQITRHRHEINNIGFFSGWGGVIAALTHLAVLWDDEKLLQEASTIVKMLPPLITHDEGLDIMGGSAGCIAGLLCLDSVAPSHQIEDALLLCGERLAKSAVSLPNGTGWKVFKGVEPLTGFAHGSAGFAWALLKLAHRTDNTRFHQLALDTLAYERSLYDPIFKNWRDMRSLNSKQEVTFRTAWCHGAPGIGLARLDTLEVLDTPLVRAEIQAALETTLAGGFGGNHALCHGDLGNLEFLYKAQQYLPDRRWQGAYEMVKASLFENGRQHGWLCGTPQMLETPGLMIGLAGICLQLLRLAEPQHIPSILTMDGPSIKGLSFTTI